KRGHFPSSRGETEHLSERNNRYSTAIGHLRKVYLGQTAQFFTRRRRLQPPIVWLFLSSRGLGNSPLVGYSAGVAWARRGARPWLILPRSAGRIPLAFCSWWTSRA